METTELMAIFGGHMNDELLKRNEYLAAENEILRSKIVGKIKFTDDERRTLARLAKDLGREALADIGPVVKPDTLMAWYRKLIAEKYDSSANRQRPGRPCKAKGVEELVLRIAMENESWGYDRISGALKNLGYEVSDETVGNILRRNGIYPSRGRQRGMFWSEFLHTHKDVIVGCDFFTTEVITPKGLFAYYVLFFIKIGSTEVHIAGVTPNPNETWMNQIARNVTMAGIGFLDGCKYVLIDRDSKYCASFRSLLRCAGMEPITLPAMSPDLNAYAERWVLTIKSECLWKLILIGEQSLWNALKQFVEHYHEERNHQGLDNVIPFVKKHEDDAKVNSGPIQRWDRLGRLLEFYYREAA